MMQRIPRRSILTGGALGLAGILLTASGCGQRGRKAYRLAASLQGLTAEFMQLWLRAARAHPAVTAGSATLTVFDGRMDALTQANQIDSIVTARYDAIIFIPVDVQAGLDAARRARAAGIPIIGSNTLLADKSLYASYIGSDDVEAGRSVASAVIDRLHGAGNVVVIEGPIGHSAQIQRREGITAILKASAQIKVLGTRSANWSRAEALALMENWLTAHSGQINGVIAQNDEMALGALEAVKARGIDPRTAIQIAGIDGISDALDAVKRGEMTTTLQDATAQAQGSVDLALRALIGAAYVPLSAIWQSRSAALDWANGAGREYQVPWVPVTLDNVDQLIALRHGS